MREIFVKKECNICLGREGEDKATKVIFDISDMVQTFGDGTVSLIAQRANDAYPYPCVVERIDTQVIWIATSADTAQAGNGYCELNYSAGESFSKSQTWRTVVLDSLGEPTAEAPEPYQGYMDKMLKMVDDCKSAYEYAQDGGFTGTEEEFAQMLAKDSYTKDEIDTMFGSYATDVATLIGGIDA